MKGKGQAVYSSDLHDIQQKETAIRLRVKKMVKESGILVENADTNYVFIRFVMDHLHQGIDRPLDSGHFSCSMGQYFSSTKLTFSINPH